MQEIGQINTSEIKPEKLIRKNKLRITVVSGFALCFILLAAFSPLLFKLFQKKYISKKIVMTLQNEHLWGHYPGDSKTHIIRKYNFMEPLNLIESIFLNQKPKFKQIQGFQFEELQDFQNIQFKDNNNYVSYDWWLHFINSNNSKKSLNQTIKILNLVPLGIWHQIKTASPQLITLQGLSKLIINNIEQQFKMQIISQTIFSLYLQTQKQINSLLKRLGFSQDMSSFIYNDPVNGWNKFINLGQWIKASLQKYNESNTLYLMNYFSLSLTQMERIKKYFFTCLMSIQKTIFDNYYCRNNNCSSFELMIQQFNESKITNNPPVFGGIKPYISICQMNQTCEGYPQLYAFHKRIFPTINSSKIYESLVFPKQCFYGFFNHSSVYLVKNENTLFHIGNLKALFGNGSILDKDNQNKQALSNIMTRFNLPSLDHSYVFWQWIKYLNQQFINKKSSGGSNEITGLASFINSVLYQVFAKVNDFLLIQLTSIKVMKLVQNNYKTCNDFIFNVMNPPTQCIDRICNDFNYSSSQTYKNLIHVCQNPYSSYWQQYRSKYELYDKTLINFCDISNFGNYIKQSQQYLYNFYKCNLNKIKKCTPYQLAIKQWSTSQITLNPIPQSSFAISNTINNWTNITQFEYFYFSQKFKNSSKIPFQSLSLNDSVKLMNFDRLFNAPMIQKIFLLQDLSKFQQLFIFKQPSQLRNYLRWIVIHVVFKDLTIQKTAYQLLFGYENEMLQKIKNTDPAMGGDPSIDSFVHYNQKNISQSEASQNPQQLWTGKNDVMITRYYKSLNNKSYTTYKNRYWNGNETEIFIDSPFLQRDYFKGSDCFQNKLEQNKNINVSIYISNLYRYSFGDKIKEYEKYGQNVYLFHIDKDLMESIKDNPQKKIYSQEYQGFINMTNITKTPVFISKNHFYDSTNWSKIVDIYDQNQSFIYTPNQWDNSYIQIQVIHHNKKHTGTGFSITLFLQTNYLLQNDQLFPTNLTAMLPIFSIYRSGNVSEQEINKKFGVLKTFLKLKWIIPLCLGIVALIFLIILLLLILRHRKLKKYLFEEIKYQRIIQENKQEATINPSIKQ